MTTEKVKVYTGPLPPKYEKIIPHHERSSSLPQNHDRKWSHLSNKSFTSTSAKKVTLSSEFQWPAIFYRFEHDGRAACKLDVNTNF